MQQLFNFRAGAQTTDTSRAAASRIEPKAFDLRRGVLTALSRFGPSTADEVADYMGESILSIRPRFSELRKRGQIQDTTKRRENKSGRRAIVWDKKNGGVSSPAAFDNINNEHQMANAR